MIVYIFIIFFSVLLLNQIINCVVGKSLIEGLENQGDSSYQMGQLTNQVNTNTNDIKSIKNQLVGMNTNINTLMESQKQEKQVKGATGKNPNSTPDASAATP
jgi:5-bromo-4-chloroindolyl phosphate hydrolysis protein